MCAQRLKVVKALPGYTAQQTRNEVRGMIAGARAKGFDKSLVVSIGLDRQAKTSKIANPQNIYDLIKRFYSLLQSENWVKNYIFWELELLKVIGYDLEFARLVDKQIIDNQLTYISKSTTEKKIVPNFLIDKSPEIEKLSTLLDGLKLVGDYLEKTILKPNNLTQPISRLQFINTLK